MTHAKRLIAPLGMIKRPVFICLLLALVTLVVYQPVLKAQFLVYDDPDYVTANQHVLTGLTWENLRWAFVTDHADNWHPLTWISHMLDCSVFGLNAPAQHLVNVLLHIASTLLLFLWLQRITAAKWRSALVAGLFALHPLHVQSVAWIAERKDVLSMLFWMLTLWSYGRHAKREGGIRYFLALLFLTLGLMAKPMLVTLPCVLLLIDYWPLKRFAEKKPAALILEKIPFFILSAAVSVITLAVQKRHAMASLGEFPLSSRLENTVVSYMAYLGKTLCPFNLAVIYPYNIHPAPLQVIVATLSLALISGYIVFLRKQRPYLLTGWLWFLGTLLPVIGIIQVGDQAMADRYAYIPSIGLFIMIAWGSADIGNALKIPTTPRAVLTALALAACALITRMQLPYWHDSIALFEHAICCTADNNIAQDLLGRAFADQQQHDQAVIHYGAALQIQPSDPKTWNNMGLSLLAMGRLDEAIHACQEALRLNPNFEDARNNLAVALNQAGRSDEAIKQFSEALRLDPGNPGTHYNLGNLYMNTGSLDEALAQYSEALRLNPGFAEAHSSIAIILLAEGKVPDAINHYATALQLQPDNLQAMNALAWIYATSADAGFRNDNEAILLAEQACKITGLNNPGALDILAAAYANAGRFSDAVRTASQALALADASGQVQLSQLINSRLALYNAGRPYRAPIIPATPVQKAH